MKTCAVSNRRRDSQNGYALLMIFLMAAIIALMLYQQLPRVAFESERDKEQLLIDRGEQYTRAIQLYYLANNRQYPTSIDDLEKREKRFLRRRYVDPFTGKDEWRIIHTNGGFLTDSLVQKPPTANDSKSASNTTNSTGNTTNNTAGATSFGGTPGGTTGTDQPPQVNAAVLQRPSDRPLTPTPGFDQTGIVQDPSQQGGNTALPPITLAPQQAALPPITLQPGSINQPGGLPPITLTPVGAPQGAGPNSSQIPGQLPGQIRPGQGAPGQNTNAPFPGAVPGGIQAGVPPGFQINASGQLVPANTANPGQVPGQIPGQIPGVPGQQAGFPGQPGIPGQPFAQQPGNQFPSQTGVGQPAGPPGTPTAAVSAINQLLTTPRQTATTTPTTSSNQIGAIAGIASTHKGPSIKVYKDQTVYEKWEFVFSPTASTVPGAAVPPGGIPGQAPAGPNGPGPNGGFGGPNPPGIGAPNFGPGGQSPFGAGPAR